MCSYIEPVSDPGITSVDSGRRRFVCPGGIRPTARSEGAGQIQAEPFRRACVVDDAEPVVLDVCKYDEIAPRVFRE